MKKIKVLILSVLCFVMLGCNATAKEGFLQNTLFAEKSWWQTVLLGAGISEPGEISVRFIDVGQADSTLIECNGHYMLIDGGNSADSSLIYSVLEEEGVDTLDILIVTHAHEDHVGGIPAAFEYVKDIKEVLCSVKESDCYNFDVFKERAKAHGGIRIPEIGEEYDLGGASVKILGLNGGNKDNVNDQSVIVRIDYRDVSFLLTGDAEKTAEATLLESGADIDVDVLKVGHHGSGTSSSQAFLDAVTPEYAVISVGGANDYGHPPKGILERLAATGAKLFRTDWQGDVIITSDGENISVETDREASMEQVMTPGGKVEAVYDLDPQGAATRAQVATFIYRFCEAYEIKINE